ncbi:MAG: DEAD/DEAH box helicase [Syntrophales bacterium LBB04]|nr:DEAD/DEAH box helicase [Syntrophales bacterium LBB04]
MTFSELGINKEILQGLTELGFTTPTPVQDQIIPTLLAKQVDMIGLAQTGTGKTAAFGVPILQLLDLHRKQTQALILCPTRELCVQVAKDIAAYAKYLPAVNILAVYGGASMETQINALRRGIQIIVATPGRLHDLMRRGKVNINAIRTVVLDEADEMLQMGFQDELNAILAETPADKNTLLFSATMSREVAAIAGKYMTAPVEVTVGRRNAGAENVDHIYYMVQAKDRYPALKRIVDSNPDIYSIIFCRTRQETQEVADKLMQDGYNADALHGELSQTQRDLVMNKFRRRNLQLLVATDVAARGLDVNDLTHVINYNLPDEDSQYTHRSGRTGRAGKAGISIAIIHLREKHRIKEIEGKLKRTFQKGLIPSGQEVCEKQLLRLIEIMKQVDVDHKQINPFLPSIMATLADLDREELIKRFVSVEFNRFLEYYRNAPDLNVVEYKKVHEIRNVYKGGQISNLSPNKSVAPTKFKDTKFTKPSTTRQFTRFILNVGKKDGANPGRLIGEINEATGNRGIRFGKIEIMNTSTMLEVESTFSSQILLAFEGLMINGKPVVIGLATDKRPAKDKRPDYAKRPVKEGSRTYQKSKVLTYPGQERKRK